MGELKAKLLAAAQLRSATVSIDGEDYTVREGSAVAFVEYMSLLQVDRDRATATLLADSVVDEKGGPLLTVDEAVAVARSARVSMALMRSIMELSGFSEKEPDAG
jgi:hypothetical protein